MKKYPVYKDSGIDWLGEIPEHWDIWKLRHAFNQIGSGTTPKTDNKDYYIDGEVNWVLTGDLNDSLLFETSKKITSKALTDYSTLRQYPTGSLVIAMYGATIGKLAILMIEATVNQACCVISQGDTISIKFLYYWFLANRKHIISLSYGGGQPNISQEIIKELRIQKPSSSEQTAITNFLDHKIQQIDDLIERKKRLIELLKEERTAVINQAVTKGLDPDVPMKDSGIEWLGEIPEHWELAKLRRYCQVKRGASPRPIDDPKYFDDEGEFAWVRIADVSASEKYLLNTTQTLSELGSSLSVKKYPNEIFLSIAGTVGKPIITKIKCCIHDGFVYFEELNLNPEFLYYIFYSGRPYLGLGKWGTQLNLNTDTVADIYIGVPSMKEQQKIVTYIVEELDRIDSIINQNEKQISLIEEYKTSLINEAVTGKIDVCDSKLSHATE